MPSAQIKISEYDIRSLGGVLTLAENDYVVKRPIQANDSSYGKVLSCINEFVLVQWNDGKEENVKSCNAKLYKLVSKI